MERFSDQALVLSTLDYGDADRLATLFCRQKGKVTAFAAGARKSKRRFAGALEPFTLISAQMVERHGGTVRLDNAEILRSHHPIRDELALIARALYCLELVRELLQDSQPHPELFDALAEYLQKLEEKSAGPTSLLAFELLALELSGLRPRFDLCALCGNGLYGSLKFDPDHGGAVCAGCGSRAPHARAVEPSLMEQLSALQRGERLPLPAAVRKRARELLNQFIAHHLGRSLKSVHFMEQVGLD